MTRQNYLQLKADLKDLASKIRPVKIEYNQSQRELSLLKNGDDGYPLMKKINEALSSKLRMKWDYRHLHIVYCLVRGKTMEQIEQKVREGNEPDQYQIKSIKEKYRFDETDPDPMILEDNLMAIQG